MIELINMPLTDDLLQDFPGEELGHFCEKLGVSGVEAIWGDTPLTVPVDKSLVRGWHLTFFCDWIDLWQGNFDALDRKFGSRKAWQDFYGDVDRYAVVEAFRKDLQRAREYGAEYVVWHVSDVSIEECYTYSWLHSDEEVVDACCELINMLMENEAFDFWLLLENLNWAGLNFLSPDLTKRLFSGINYEKKGFMLDVGHLMCTNPEIRTQEEGIAYVLKVLEEHRTLLPHIKGLHMHQSVSGRYVRDNTGYLLPDGSLPRRGGQSPGGDLTEISRRLSESLESLPEDYIEKFIVCYKHILNIDTHRPFTSKYARSILELVQPEYLVHELAAPDPAAKAEAVAQQRGALGL